MKKYLLMLMAAGQALGFKAMAQADMEPANIKMPVNMEEFLVLSEKTGRLKRTQYRLIFVKS